MNVAAATLAQLRELSKNGRPDIAEQASAEIRRREGEKK